MDVLAEYQRLKKAATEADGVVIRAEAMVEEAEREAREAAADAQAAGFSSLAEVEARRAELLSAAEAAIQKVKEAVS